MKETIEGFRVGDEVIIDNLEGCRTGIIGFKGNISKITDSGWCHLEPTCPGGSFQPQNLRHTNEGTRPILIKVPVI